MSVNYLSCYIIYYKLVPHWLHLTRGHKSIQYCHFSIREFSLTIVWGENPLCMITYTLVNAQQTFKPQHVFESSLAACQHLMTKTLHWKGAKFSRLILWLGCWGGIHKYCRWIYRCQTIGIWNDDKDMLVNLHYLINVLFIPFCPILSKISCQARVNGTYFIAFNHFPFRC